MNGTGMYKLKPIYDENVDVGLPNCMYKMSSIYGKDPVGRNVPNGIDEDDPVAALERRQERMLEKLNKLKSDVEMLSKQMDERATTCNVVQSSSVRATRILDDSIHDIVINANPSQPPLGLMVLHHLLTPRARTCTSVHVHSSVTSIDDKLRKCLLNGTSTERSNAQIVFTLIWKKVNYGPEMNIAPVSQTPIHGEANIARYLARLLDPSYESSPELATLIDSWLDLASNTMTRGSSKEKAVALRALNSHLGKNTWLVGSSLTLADVIMWSAVYQSGQAKGVPNNVNKWLKACEENSAFQFAKALIS
ncbi:aminoacyl tRNA synthase complex-interacting multifunctional protein 2-like [Glandiceps talaboti]